MHDKMPNETLVSLRRGVAALPEADRSIGRAYVMGFICHYLLDSTVHPFVYSQQYALCDAGVEGLDRKAGSDVHAVIESEIDEVVLNVKRGETIATFNPSKLILARERPYARRHLRSLRPHGAGGVRHDDPRRHVQGDDEGVSPGAVVVLLPERLEAQPHRTSGDPASPPTRSSAR